MTPPPAPEGILVDRELRAGLARWIAPRADAPPVEARQVQPTSLDLRLGALAYPVRAGFLPERTPVAERLAELGSGAVRLDGDGAVVRPGEVVLVPLAEGLRLDGDLRARFNPRSSTGRCDVFTRVVVPGHPRFDEAPAGYRGELWLEVAPLSFAIRIRAGDRLTQLRLVRGRAELSAPELADLVRETPLVFDREGPLAAGGEVDTGGGLSVRVGLAERDPCGFRARVTDEVLELGAERRHEPTTFWEPVHAERGHCILEPGHFYLFASRERLRVPPWTAAEMLPVDVGIGELRNNYAGFFDSGFGWDRAREDGTPAVLEVRAHDVPFLVEDGQVFARLRFFRATGEPENLYGEGREGASYRGQDLTLARAFR